MGFKDEVIDCIKTERTKQGISQKEFARKLGLYQHTICDYETGIHEPKLDMTERMLKELGYEIRITKTNEIDNVDLCPKCGSPNRHSINSRNRGYRFRRYECDDCGARFNTIELFKR